MLTQYECTIKIVFEVGNDSMAVERGVEMEDTIRRYYSGILYTRTIVVRLDSAPYPEMTLEG